jgi:hypothetical protein
VLTADLLIMRYFPKSDDPREKMWIPAFQIHKTGRNSNRRLPIGHIVREQSDGRKRKGSRKDQLSDQFARLCGHAVMRAKGPWIRADSDGPQALNWKTTKQRRKTYVYV